MPRIVDISSQAQKFELNYAVFIWMVGHFRNSSMIVQNKLLVSYPEQLYVKDCLIGMFAS